ncbi:hypothetical protein HY256_09845, partial [Candidatus Sumerlaeota bacterium]|nr:hypothetical protein [Candidatus Sumerlaeota bacterium]
ELLVTRVFSVLFFYHYSSFAIALIMSGLTLGGLAVSRWNTLTIDAADFQRRMGLLCLAFSALIIGAFLCVILHKPMGLYSAPEMKTVILLSVVFLPGLICAGAFLAAAFARGRESINRLYAIDLIAAAAACIGSIYLMRLIEGPATLLGPSLLGACTGCLLLPRKKRWQIPGGGLALLAAAGLAANYYTNGDFLRLPLPDQPAFERWNEHSRITLFPMERDGRAYYYLVIDKTAATTIWPLRHRTLPAPPPVEDWWDAGPTNVGYRTGRPVNQAAIIGVGGGVDILAPLAHGAKRVDGYELNQIILDLHRSKVMQDFNGIGFYPEVHLIHGEARVGIKHSGKKYDVIQASLIDTWAATASGGFVLSENGLYTVEGWDTFLSALTDAGILTMTRWYVPMVPSEVQRLVSLAIAGLEHAGIQDPAAHIILVSNDTAEGAAAKKSSYHGLEATILVSKTAFRPEEINTLKRICDNESMHILAAPGMESSDEVIRGLLNPATRRMMIEDNYFDLTPTTDMRPYFFLLLRPLKALEMKGGDHGTILEITLNGTRIMMILGIMSLTFALVVLLFAQFTLPSPRTTPEGRALYHWMSLYFWGIGFGYIFIQLGMHQRLILILGHPALALSVVLFSMLLGTGLGAAMSEKFFAETQFQRAWGIILAAVGLLILSMPFLPLIDDLGSFVLRAGVISLLMGGMGFVLGFAFPIGVRLVSPSGEWAVQKMWAVNGAASIAGSAFASIIGVVFGARVVLICGLVCYLGVTLCGISAVRAARGARSESGASGDQPDPQENSAGEAGTN